MRLLLVGLFLTLVGTPSLAVPRETSDFPPMTGSNQTQDVQTTPVDLEKTESIQMAIPENEPVITPERSTISHFTIRWKERQNRRFQIQAGYVNGQLLSRSETVASPFVGLLLYWKPSPEKAWDISTDFAQKGWLRLSGGKRFYVGKDRGHLPYLRLGVSQTTELSRIPTGVLDFVSMKLSAGVGFGNLFERNESWNAQFDLQYGNLGPGLQFTLGWNFDL